MTAAMTLRVLIVDDVEDDALLAQLALRRGGYTVITQRVDTAAALDAALASQLWDLILCDYSMPHFGGLEALALVRQHDPDMPFILMSGTIGEEVAVTALQVGADDYIMKDNPVRLVPGVQRVLREVDERRQRRQAEAARRASEARYRGLVETSPDAIVLLDLQGTIQMANRQAVTLYHSDPEQLVGRHAVELLVPADRDRATEALNAVAGGAISETHTYTVQRPDGSTFILEIRSTRVDALDDGGEAGIMIVARDITERIQAAERLHFQAYLLQSVGQAVIATDVAGVITYWNQAAEALYGHSAAEVVGQNILPILGTEQHRERDARNLAAVSAGRRAAHEYLARHRDGHLIPVLVTTMPLHNEHGAVVGIIGISADITARVQAEEALRQSERFAYATIDALEALLAILDADGVIIAVNAAWRAFGRDNGSPDPQAGVGTNYLAVCDAAASEGDTTARQVAQGIRDVLALRAPSFQLEYPCHAPLEQRWYIVRVTRFGGDGPVRAVVAHNNITDRVQAEQERQRSAAWYRALSEQATDLVHISDRTGAFLYVSSSFQRLLGYRPQDLVGTRVAALVHPDDLAQATEAFGSLGTDGAMAVAEFRLRHADGPWRWVEAAGTSHLSDPIIGGVIVNSRDSTARKEAEAQLTAEHDLLSTLMDAVPDALYVKDRQSRFLRVNTAQARARGVATPEEMVGKTDFDYHPPELAHQFAARERHLLTTGEPLINDLEDQSVPGQGAHWVLSSKVPLWQGEQITGLVGISRDITAFRQAQEERQRFFTLSLDLMCVATLDGYFTDVNPAFERTLGFTTQELCAEPFLAFVHPDDQKATLAEVAKLASGILTITFENRYRCKDGTYRWLLWTSVPVPAEGRLYAAAHDITERKQMEAHQNQQIARISALHTIDTAIAASLDLGVTLDVILDQVCLELDVDAAQVLLLNEHNLYLEPVAAQGFRGQKVRGLRLQMGQGHAGRAALERRLIIAPDLAEEEVVRVPLVADEGFVAYAAAPLIAKGQVHGVLEVFHRAPLAQAQDSEWIDFLVTLAGQTAIALDNARLYQRLQRSNVELLLAYDSTIEGWSRALDLRDKETEGHSQRVTAMTLRLARALGFTDDTLVHVRRGALLHDIGKMGVPDGILLKPGALTEEEWAIMRRHPTAAYELLSPVPYLRPALDIPYRHHEKWDGTGYPHGLRGEQIPLAARIFAVVDVWDALSSDRPYRAAWPPERVRAHLTSLAGSHFDPAVVQAFLALFEGELAERNTPL